MATATELPSQALLNGPSLQAPTGAMYNFVNAPNTVSAECFAVLGVTLAGALIAFSIRSYTKWMILRSFHWGEDCSLIIGTALFVAFSGWAAKLMVMGIGIHQWNIQVKNIGPLLHGINTGDIIYNFSLPFIRISILLQYLRIFTTQAKKASFMYIGCWTLIFFISTLYTITLFFQIFACSPREKYWNPLLKGHCTNTEALNIATGAFNVLTDIALVLLPQHEIWRLQMSPSKKIAVSAVFLAAIGGCIASVLRLYYSVVLEQTGDVIYYMAVSGIYGTIENAVGIICCCLPVFPKFFRVVGPKLASLYKSSFSNGTHGSNSSFENFQIISDENELRAVKPLQTATKSILSSRAIS